MRRPWDRHPPWAHPAFFIVWILAGSLGPIMLGVGLIVGAAVYVWVGGGLCAIWALDLALDWLLVRTLRRRDPDWRPWQPPQGESLAATARRRRSQGHW